MPDPATSRQRRRRAYISDHPARYALITLTWVLALNLVGTLLFRDTSLRKALEESLIMWSLLTILQVMIVRHDRATAWYADWRADHAATA